MSPPLAEAPSTADAIVGDLDAVTRRRSSPPGLPALGFYSHVDAETRRAAEAAGIDLVVPRSRMARELPALVEGLLSAG